METGRNVPWKKNKCMKIVQDLPSNTEDLESGRKQTDAASLCLMYRKNMCKVFQLTQNQQMIA